MVNKYIGSLLSIRHACLKTLFRVQMRTHLGYFPVGTFGFLFHLCFPQTFLVFLKDVRRLGSNSYLCRPEPLQLVPVPAPFCFLEGKGGGGVSLQLTFLPVVCGRICHLPPGFVFCLPSLLHSVFTPVSSCPHGTWL